MVHSLVVAILAGCVSLPALADISNDLEPDYAQAVLSFNSRDYDRALSILSDLQRKSPKTPEFLELKAVTFKATQKLDQAAEAYRQLVQIKTKEGGTKKEIAPYAFELGVIRFNEKKFAQAEQYLSYSQRAEFNVEASQLYLGMIALQTKNLEKAEQNFEAVSRGTVEDLKSAAHLYLGQIYFQKGAPSSGISEFSTAKELAQAYVARTDVNPESKVMSEQIIKAVDTALSPFDRTQRFANLTFTAGYDSNVLLAPNESDAAAAGSTETTLKTTVTGAVGFATSPLRKYQYVPSARFSANKNFNKDTKSGEFTDMGLALFVNKSPLASVSYGAKVDGSIVFQNEYNQTTDSTKYRLYTSTFALGPYMKYDRHPKWTFTGELIGKLVNFNGDADITESLRRNGPVYGLKLSSQQKGQRRFFNPVYSVKTEFTDTAGTEFQSFAFGGGVTNSFQFGKFQFVQSLDLTRTNFGTSSTDRGDTLIAILVAGHRKLDDHWALLSSLDYTKNSSSDDEAYSYSRYTVNAGVSYVF